jgi:hypothetical protein
VEYIIESINKQSKIETITFNYKLVANDKVRLIEPQKALKKTRHNVNPFYYMINDVLGKSITISATGSF